MSKLDLHNDYNPIGESVHDLFDRTEEGFFVPLYQREYTWEEDNIDQLFEDLVLGIRELSDEEGDDVTTFLGTVILTDLVDKKETVQKGDARAQPTAVKLVIDGQQRIATISLLSIQLVERLKLLKDCLSNETPYKVLQNHCDDLIEILPNLYSMRLGRGSAPSNKPKIIRAKEGDRWTFAGDDDAYRSPVAHYIAKYIRMSDSEKALKAVPVGRGARVHRNVRSINEWLDAVCDAHIPNTQLYDQFPVGEKIIKGKLQECILGFEDCNLVTVIANPETNKNEKDYFASAIYHVFLLIYYLLRRCGVNRLQPTHEEWGFDMFQALNTTGTPLTAMETFLPQVIQAEQKDGNDWTETPSYEHIDSIDKLFEETKSNEQKTRRTNELLSAFALCYDAEKLGNKFSAQRRWMTNIYEKRLPTIEEKRESLGYLAQVANFFYSAWYMEDVDRQIEGIEDSAEGKLASFLVRYLKDARSKLSAPILARFYSQAVENEDQLCEYVAAAKACAAFFTLWRSARSTSGLDDIYRTFFKGSNGLVKVDKHSWNVHPEPFSSNNLKQYFLEVLKHEKIAEKEKWIAASENRLLFTEVKTICRFVLLLAGHDRVADDDHPGLTVPGSKGVCPLLTLDCWIAEDYKSLEHVAPQNPPDTHDWDTNIYSKHEVHDVGNLLLLPIDINKFVDNKNWMVKFLHYSHVGVRKEETKAKLSEEAKEKGVVLMKKATNTLSNTQYSCAVEPILKLGLGGMWDAEMIEKRTRQIKEITWANLMCWLKT